MICSLCIATYKRPELLNKLLQSLIRQLLPPDVTLEVIVVDNDLACTGRHVVQAYQDSPEMQVHYYNQPLKNISVTRNLAVTKSSGDYIAFIDDDEVANPQWIWHLLKTIAATAADGVFGPVLPAFHPTTPIWIKKGHFFELPYPPLATGDTSTPCWTGNCLVRATLLKALDEPFDASYGISGGEDAELFDRLRRQGAKFVHCNEAIAFEYIPSSRTNTKYLLMRGIRWGNGHTRRVIQFSRCPHSAMRALMLIKALAFGIVSLSLILLTFSHVRWRVYWLIKLASNIGRFLAVFGWYSKAYA